MTYTTRSTTCFVVLIAACLALFGCAAPSASVSKATIGQRNAIQIDDMTLYVSSPILLRPSKDFPQPHVASYVSLSQVKSPTSLFGGYWDARSSWPSSVKGTLQIVLSVDPWPSGADGLKSCEEKAKFIPDQLFLRRLERYKLGRTALPPQMTFEKTILANHVAYRFQFPHDSPSGESFVLPLNRAHFLYLTFSSADNSPLEGEWPQIARDAVVSFLDSLALAGETQTCN